MCDGRGGVTVCFGSDISEGRIFFAVDRPPGPKGTLHVFAIDAAAAAGNRKSVLSALSGPTPSLFGEMTLNSDNTSLNLST